MTLLTFTKTDPLFVAIKRDEYYLTRPKYIQYLAATGKLNWLPPNEFVKARDFGIFQVPGIAVHHILPLSMGGNNDFDNMMLIPCRIHENIHIFYAKTTKKLEIGESIEVKDLAEPLKNYQFNYTKNCTKKKKRKLPNLGIKSFALNQEESKNYNIKTIQPINKTEEKINIVPGNNILYPDVDVITDAFNFDQYGNIQIKKEPEHIIGAIAELQRIGIDIHKFHSCKINGTIQPYFFLKTNKEEQQIIHKIQEEILEKHSSELVTNILQCLNINADYNFTIKGKNSPKALKSTINTLTNLGFTGERKGRYIVPANDFSKKVIKNIYKYAETNGLTLKTLPLSELTIKLLSDKAHKFTL